MLLRSSSAPILGSCNFHSDLLRDHEHDGFSPMLHKVYSPLPSCLSPVSFCRASHDVLPSAAAHESLSRSGEFEKDVFPPTSIRRAQSESDIGSLTSGVASRSAASSLMTAAADEREAATLCCGSPHEQWTRRVSSCGRALSLDRNGAIWEECELSDSEVAEDTGYFPSAEMFAASSNLEGNVGGHQEQLWSPPADQFLPSPPASASGMPIESFRLEDGEVYTRLATTETGQVLVCNSKGCRPMTESERLNPMLMASGVGLGMGGGLGGRNGSRGRNGGFGDGAEMHYQNLLRGDPQNPLFLRNYAQYLAETKHEHKKAEEYYERAILACPSDGDVLSKYAKHMWDVHNDHDRAEYYFNQAMKAAPDDSYVLASYASFAWDSEDEENDSLPLAGQAFPTGIPAVVAAA